MRKMVIEKLKGIQRLEFILPENPGVYLLVGANGAGKTTILTCLNRIGDSLAFANAFKSTGTWTKADQYKTARIKYYVNGKEVCFRKENKKWAPTPRKGSRILEEFGYSGSVFISADSKRIDVKSDDIRQGNMKQVETEICDALNRLFETERYSQLKRLKNTNGRGKNSTYFYLLKDGANYYSEKRFSTGELALVRLCEKICFARENALILLDEAELALHPRVQVNLLKYLNEKAAEKKLTIFVSSHSPSMIKGIRKENLYLLNGKSIINPCYPAAALGAVDFENATCFDYVLFVEDDMARSILHYMLKRYIRIEPEKASALCYIVPVGGFEQTAAMMAHTKDRLLAQSKVFALVDQDAFENIDSKPKFKELYKQYSAYIKGLGFTPENWMVEKFENADNNLKDEIRMEFNCEQGSVIRDSRYMNCNSKKERKLAKDKFKVIVDILSKTGGYRCEVTQDKLIGMLVESMTEGEIKRTLNPVFSVR